MDIAIPDFPDLNGLDPIETEVALENYATNLGRVYWKLTYEERAQVVLILEERVLLRGSGNYIAMDNDIRKYAETFFVAIHRILWSMLDQQEKDAEDIVSRQDWGLDERLCKTVIVLDDWERTNAEEFGPLTLAHLGGEDKVWRIVARTCLTRMVEKGWATVITDETGEPKYRITEAGHQKAVQLLRVHPQPVKN